MGKGIIKGADKAPVRGLLSALGMNDTEIEKPIVGIISAFHGLSPANSALGAVADMLKYGITAAGGTAVTLPCSSVCEGMSAGLSDGGFSLAARELIADNVEMLLKSNPLDAAVLVPSGDTVAAGMIMGATRASVPVLVCGGGAIQPAVYNGQKVSISDITETMGKVMAGKGSSAELTELEQTACGSGAYGDIYSVSSFGALAEALGIALPGNGTIAASSPERKKFAYRSGAFIMELLDKNLVFKKIITADAIKNAITVNIALGGNTSNLLHLLALASELRLNVTLGDIEKINESTPVLVSFAPQGKTYLNDLDAAGGIPALMGELGKKELIKKSALTVSGTVGEIISGKETEDETVIKSISSPYAENGLVIVLKGSAAEDGCLAKIPLGSKNLKFTGVARVFNTSEEACAAVKSKKIKAGDCVVLRYMGPKGGPGMKEAALPAAVINGAGLSETVALVTDGRIPECARCLSVGHVTPEAEMGDTFALIEDGDKIEIDLGKGKINVFISSKDLSARRKKWKPRDITVTGALLRYYSQTGDAATGATYKAK